ncbi:MAG: lysophospholipid acyltransferase family protein [Deltaproteobacteria bacterium]|nr:lysophospholipid acyltransferase family protein [Deltaproteobacteria bacterium]
MLRRRTRKRVKRWLVYVVVRFWALVFLVLPLRLALSVGRWCGLLVYTLDRKGRLRARSQLERAFSGPASWLASISRGVYANLGMTAVEIARMDRLRPDFERYVVLGHEARETLASAQAEGRGVLFVTGHMGNWELLAQRIASLGFRAATLARSAPNPYLGAWLVRLREAGGLGTINRGDSSAARKILSTLRSGGLLGVLIDQSAPVPSVSVSFFGAPAPTPRVAAELAVRREVPIVFGRIWRRSGGGHEVSIERVVEDPVARAMPRQARILGLTQRLTALIEAAIRERPAEWVWFHDRWRARPEWVADVPPEA